MKMKMILKLNGNLMKKSNNMIKINKKMKMKIRQNQIGVKILIKKVVKITVVWIWKSHLIQDLMKQLTK